ncbi:MAG TPA: GHKL domain-containing protein [Clostridiales bacterium]|nr:GHKL domain-containing protein [Clostridiales bacterium]
MGAYLNIIVKQIIETSVVFYILSLLLKTRIIESRWRVVVAATIFCSAFFLAEVMGNHSEGVIGLVVQVICVNLLFKEGALKRNITYIAVYCGTGLMAAIVYGSIGKVSGIPADQILDSSICVFIAYFMAFFAAFISRWLVVRHRKIFQLLRHMSAIDILLFASATVLWAFGITYYGELRDGMAGSSWDVAIIDGTKLLYSFSFLIIIGYIWKSIMSQRYKKESLMNAELLDLREKYYKKLIENNREVRRFKHDFQAHMTCLRELSNMEKFDEIKEYLNRMGNDLGEVSNKFNVGNEIANIVLNGFYEEMVTNHIELVCTGKFRGNVKISSHEICALFYNMMKNAIEACMQVNSDKRAIHLNIKSYYDSMVIEISNSVSEPVDIVMIGKGGTRKEDKKNHGYGMDNMKRIIQRYGGAIKYKNDRDRFVIEMVLHDVYDDWEHELS